MKKRAIAGLSLSALMLGGTVVGCAQGGISTASTRSEAKLAASAASNAAKAQQALAKGDAARAITFAEAAVAAMPRDAELRALLGASYLKAGRFTSAHEAYADVLQLAPTNGKAALNLALAMIAEGQWDQARALLEEHAAIVPAADRGLATALAGDPASGAELLMGAARAPDATATTRQNFALVLALAGRWAEARQIAGIDMAPQAADARMLEWATFAKPTGAADQVSALLGVIPVKDPGLPVALALNATVPVTALAAVQPAAMNPETTAPGVPAEQPVEVAQVAPQVPVAATDTSASGSRIVFAARQEVVQSLPAGRAPPTPAAAVAKTRLASATSVSSPRERAKGDWYVQLGAFDSAGVAKDAWQRAQRRYPALAEQTPTGMAFKSFYRLSVGGFSRNDAESMCRGYRATGGRCFVRTGAGDQTASWVKPAKVQLAVR